VTGAGVLNLASALTPAMRGRIAVVRTVFTPEITDVAAGATALLGVALVLLGRGIVRYRRASYVGALVVLVLSAFTHVIKGLDLEETVVALGVAVLLLRSGRLFGAPMPAARSRTLVRAVPCAVAVGFAYGMVGFAIHHAQVRPRFSFALAFEETSARLIGLSGPLHVHGRLGGWFPGSITVLGFAAISVLAAIALAPVAERTSAPGSERDRARRLVQRADGDTLDPFALREDKRYVFSADGKAAIAYRYVAGVGLSTGDPIGAPASVGDALAGFLVRCDRYGWRPAFLGVRCDCLAPFEAAGLRSLYLGDEAVIDVNGFTLEGRAMRPVRQAVNRTKNFGVTTEFVREGDLDPTLRRALVGIAERSRRGAPERGFAMALDGLLSGRDGDCLLVIARGSNGAPIAFQRYVPCRAGSGLSLDAMRRDDVPPNGVNERMIANVVGWARSHGVRHVSLNFAAFRWLLREDAQLNPFQTAEAWFMRRISPYFQLESLLAFDAKFGPRWVPRHLVFRNAAEIPAIGVAALSAESFLPFDRGPRVLEA
jgi:lysyl-tRNA synthetase class 2